ncbi:hypothetical protein Tco_0436659 [Tanacetum coccineum]
MARYFMLPRAVGILDYLRSISVYRWPVITLLHDFNYHRARFRVKPAGAFVYLLDYTVGLWRAYTAKYGYIRNHKKTIKNKQARTRESEEYKKKPKNQSRSQKSQASVKSRVSQIQGAMVQFKNSSTMQWSKCGKSRVLLLTLKRSNVNNGEINKEVWVLWLNYSLKEAQMLPKENDTLAILSVQQFDRLKWIATLAIHVRSLGDPTAKNKDPMID